MISLLCYFLQDQVNQYAHNVVQGMLALLKNCPQEVAHLRRELLIAARHILATDLRNSEQPDTLLGKCMNAYCCVV